MTRVGTFTVEDHVGIVAIDSPPVNALGVDVRKALDEGILQFKADAAVRAIVVMCGGRTFFAGADISEFGKPPREPSLRDVLSKFELCGKPVIAAIHGTALGGGYELALACHYRIAVASSKVGLPEVKLGLLPGGGGTQRLPRIVGAAAALDIMVSGVPIAAARALELGMIDALAGEGSLRADAIAFAKRLLAEGKPLRRVRDRQDKIERDKGNPIIFEDFRRTNARAMRGFKAPECIIEAVQAAVELPFDEGMALERELFLKLLSSRESAAQRYYFFAERETIKIPDIPQSTATIPVNSVGVIGGGTMGTGITMNFLNIGVPVTLVEMSQEALDRGLSIIRKNYENMARRGRISEPEVKQRMALIKPAICLKALSEVDLVIEAVFELMEIKRNVFAKLDDIAKQGAILATNTSYLDVNEIATATCRPEWVVGLHFFSPANVMRLLEVVCGDRTSSEVVATGMKLARAIGKVPVLSRVCNGFIANRVMSQRGREADALILEGPTPAEVDQAIRDFGFAMGPFEMRDLVGLDVTGRDQTERTVRGDLVNLGRLGQKKNGGYYDYDGGRIAVPSPIATEIIAEFAKYKGIENKGQQSPEDIVARLLYPVVNECAKVLEEEIALRASDIDVACILGYNWPIYTGGPMFWADTVGLPNILDKLEEFEQRYGEAFKPARLLREKAASGGSFTRS